MDRRSLVHFCLVSWQDRSRVDLPQRAT
jgi:hypothetical protein